MGERISKKHNGGGRRTYETTVMLRITGEYTSRLDKAVIGLSRQERAQGRARKIGRATIVYEAMLRGLPLLEQEMAASEQSGESNCAKEQF